MSYYEAYNNIEETCDNDGACFTTRVEDIICNPKHYTLPDKTCYVPRCGMCNPKTHFRLEGICELCPTYPWLMPVIMVTMAIFGGIGTYIFSKWGINAVILNIGIDYFQVLSLFAGSKVTWPIELRFIFITFKWFMFDIDMTAPECMARQLVTYENKFYFKMALPFLGSLIILVITISSRIIKCFKWMVCGDAKTKQTKQKKTKKTKGSTEQKKSNEKKNKNNKGLKFLEKEQKKREALHNNRMSIAFIISLFVTMVYFLYLMISRAALEIFNCVPTDPPTGRFYLATEPMEECGVKGGLQQRLQPLAVIFLLFYTVGFPVGIGIYFSRNGPV